MRVHWGLFSLIFLLAGLDAEAWFCTEAASRRIGMAYEVCGVAVGSSEPGARDAALQNAIHEFRTLCDISDDCRGRKVSVDPKRTECRAVGDQVECRRMIQVSIGPSFSKEDPQVDAKEGKVRLGGPLAEAIRVVGEPDQIIDADHERGVMIYHYFGRACCAFQSCSLVVRNGVVERQSGMKGELIAPAESKSLSNFWKLFF